MQTENKTYVNLPYDFKGKFGILKETIEKQQNAIANFHQNFANIQNELNKHDIPCLGFVGSVEDIQNQWTSAADSVNQMISYFDSGFENKDILELNKFITICDSFERTNKNFEEFSKFLEQMQSKIQGFNDDFGKFEPDKTIAALRQQQEQIIIVVNTTLENIKTLQNDMYGLKVQAINEIGNRVGENLEKIKESNKELNAEFDNISQNAKHKLRDFSKKFEEQLEIKLETWKSLNITNYKNFTKFAFGFYAFNFGLAFLLGALFLWLYSEKNKYAYQTEILRNANEATKILARNGDFSIKKEGGKTTLNFVAKQNLTISNKESGVQIIIKED